MGHTSTASEVRHVKFKTVKTVQAVRASHTRYRIGTEIKHGSHKIWNEMVEGNLYTFTN